MSAIVDYMARQKVEFQVEPIMRQKGEFDSADHA
jgi:hypothetical protein